MILSRHHQEDSFTVSVLIGKCHLPDLCFLDFTKQIPHSALVIYDEVQLSGGSFQAPPSRFHFLPQYMLESHLLDNAFQKPFLSQSLMVWIAHLEKFSRHHLTIFLICLSLWWEGSITQRYFPGTTKQILHSAAVLQDRGSLTCLSFLVTSKQIPLSTSVLNDEVAYLAILSGKHQITLSTSVLDGSNYLHGGSFNGLPNRFYLMPSSWWQGCLFGDTSWVLPNFPGSSKQNNFSASVLDGGSHLPGNVVQALPSRFPFLPQSLIVSVVGPEW